MFQYLCNKKGLLSLTYGLLICRALVDHSLGKDLPDIFIKSFECLPGRGLFATLTGIKVCNQNKGSSNF